MSKQKPIMRTSKHSLKFANGGKLEALQGFVVEARRVLQVIVDTLWEKGYQDTEYHFDTKTQKYNLPTMLCSKYLHQFNDMTWLSARLLQALGKQASSIVRGTIKKHTQRIYVMKKLQRSNKPCGKLQSKVDKNPFTKPTIQDNISIDLDQRFVDVEETQGDFNEFIRLASLARRKTAQQGLTICLPLKYTKVSNKWVQKGVRSKSIKLREDSLNLIYEIPSVPKRTVGKVVGADQGYKTCLTLSDGQASAEDQHDHDLESISKKISKKQKGSLAFKKAQDHRLNHINWVINQFNLNDVREVRYEDVKQIRYKEKNTFNPLRHWTYPLIKAALYRRADLEGFQVTLVGPAYRSQRCSVCGLVLKGNRNGKEYRCRGCGSKRDSDLNAAVNLSLDLPEIPIAVRRSHLNLTGFYWNSFDSGKEPIVPYSKNLKA